MVRMRSEESTSSELMNVDRCPERSRPIAAAALSAPPEAGLPSHAPTPAERTSRCVHPRSAICRRAMTSAIGDRHVFPVQTNRTLIRPPSRGHSIDFRYRATQSLHGDRPLPKDPGTPKCTVYHRGWSRPRETAPVDEPDVPRSHPLEPFPRFLSRSDRRFTLRVQTGRGERRTQLRDESGCDRMRAQPHPNRATLWITNPLRKRPTGVSQDECERSGPEYLRKLLRLRRPLQPGNGVPIGDQRDQRLSPISSLQSSHRISRHRGTGATDAVYGLRRVRDETTRPDMRDDAVQICIGVTPQIDDRHALLHPPDEGPRAARIASASTRSTGRVTFRFVPPSSTMRIRPPAASTRAASSVAAVDPEA